MFGQQRHNIFPKTGFPTHPTKVQNQVIVMEQFGNKLQRLQKFHGLTLKQLALKLDYTTHSYLSEIETGVKMPPVDLVLKISHLFKVTTDELLKDNIEIDLPFLHFSKEK